jgi:heme/copper-type cytochrome/quinol oxidase subunit 4
MKFKKEVQGIIGTITTIAFMLLATTIESDWTKEYLIFAGINLVILVSGVILLHKYGRFE